ncbi:MFS transporter [Azoarcus sp. KH32C]|uniref:MFS transporter n=1 Tax=Azoarcus sp. KH32C TaxID=748247 RepID=UPI0002385C99|nr:MFS transporter [Azoarcus sp. KH32C]BAL26914.1 major facilitator superfamily MFS_1, MFS transporter, MHS family, proline/betaine transporter [Azoarcus sp. KH32C]
MATQEATLQVPYTNTSEEQRVLRRAAAGSFIGNFVEWFDYAAYGYLATIIASVFFPSEDKTTALMSTFAVFAISFFIRPIGGIIWGHIGDRVGRREALSLSILIMSASTVAIAFLPGYDTAGIWAPVLLLLVRMVQGFSASGEYAGASAFIAEYAPPEHRGFYTSLVPASTAAGLLFGSLLVAGMHSWLTAEQLHDWGWRLPFLLAAPFGLIGRYIRNNLEDTPAFRKMESTTHHAHEAAPISQLLGPHRRAVLVSLGVACLNAVGFYVLLSYMPTYLSTEQGLSESSSFLAATISLVTYIGFIFAMGSLSDRVGRKAMLVVASLVFIGASVPLFKLLPGAEFMTLVGVQIAFGALLAMNDGTLACFLAEMFPTRIRYSGFAFSFNLANTIFGGTAPFMCTWLIKQTGNAFAPAWYLVAAAVVALIALMYAKVRDGKAFDSVAG